ncbi:hypothetical protein Scep_014620 [Stephania cephalantha]|uniref:Uncharacterized protein n=1 Tax=Stephania cephalantha TaxID=152367 RepID=A0AAP0J1K8_9MAGN
MLRYEQDMERKEQYQRNGEHNFLLFVDHHIDIARYEMSRRLRPTDRSLGFPAAPAFVFNWDLVQSKRVERPLTPSKAGANAADVEDNAQSRSLCFKKENKEMGKNEKEEENVQLENYSSD